MKSKVFPSQQFRVTAHHSGKSLTYLLNAVDEATAKVTGKWRFIAERGFEPTAVSARPVTW